MLSSDAVHTLSTCLIAADADAEQQDWGRPPTLLLIHDWLLTPATPTRRRGMRSVEFPLHPDDLLTDPSGLPALLHRLATDLENASQPTPYKSTLDTIISRIRASTPDARLVAWAACYRDIHTQDGQPRQARQVDAVDADGRRYKVTRLRGEDAPLVLVIDTPDPTDIPATHPGLVALMAATARYTQPTAAAATPPQIPARTDPDDPVFTGCGPDGESLRCLVCGAVNEITSDEMPSMAGYGQDTYVRCTRCGSAETTDPIFGWHAQPATWPPTTEPDQP